MLSPASEFPCGSASSGCSLTRFPSASASLEISAPEAAALPYAPLTFPLSLRVPSPAGFSGTVTSIPDSADGLSCVLPPKPVSCCPDFEPSTEPAQAVSPAENNESTIAAANVSRRGAVTPTARYPRLCRPAPEVSSSREAVSC